MDKIERQVNDVLAMIEKDGAKKKVLKFLTHDVQGYLHKLVKLEQKIYSEGVVLPETNKKFFMLTDEIIEKAEKIEKIIGQRILIEKIKKIFRLILNNSPIYKSVLVKRAYEKPRGYPGDYKMIESFYANKPISKGIGFCGDKYILNDNYVKAVRNRKDKMKSILSEFIKNSELSSIKILNIGCGSCKEIRELFTSDFSTTKKLIFTVIDQDEDALLFSRKELGKLSKHIQQNVKFKFIKESVLNFIKNKKYKKMLENQDMIYSIGLADYIPDYYLGRLIAFSSELLDSKGVLVIAHKNIKNYKALAPDWFCGWTFFPRDKRDLVDLVNTHINKNNYDMTFRKEKMKYIFFMNISKL